MNKHQLRVNFDDLNQQGIYSGDVLTFNPLRWFEYKDGMTVLASVETSEVHVVAILYRVERRFVLGTFAKLSAGEVRIGEEVFPADKITIEGEFIAREGA